MALDRNSEMLLETLGIDKTTSGAAQVLTSFTNIEFSSINGMKFDYVTGYYTSRGVPKSIAQTMALIMLDAAKSLKTSPQRLLYDLEQSSDIDEVIDIYAVLNVLRRKITQVKKVSAVDNSKSYRSRAIRA